LRDPNEIFTGVLDEEEQVELVSGLKLCRRMLHREPVIELIGADSYKFAELRSLGLLNEQIDWKQRFFVPIDEEKAIAVLESLFARYPVVPSAASAESAMVVLEPPELSMPQFVNLDEWVMPATRTVLTSSPAPDETETAEPTPNPAALYVLPAAVTVERTPQTQLALDFA
jgi:hypothetical protein